STLTLPTDDLMRLPSVTRVDAAGNRQRLATREPHRTIPALYLLISGRDGELTELNTHNATLDDVFLALTGRQLRDA
ncbi:MAG: ABC transporter ATP-binding protein, partial [Gemmatimonadota bacterium]